MKGLSFNLKTFIETWMSTIELLVVFSSWHPTPSVLACAQPVNSFIDSFILFKNSFFLLYLSLFPIIVFLQQNRLLMYVIILMVLVCMVLAAEEVI